MYFSGSDDATRDSYFSKSSIHARCTDWLKIGKSTAIADDEYDMIMYLYRHGPIAVSLSVENLRLYSKKILSFCGGNHSKTNQVVVLTGFEVSDGGTPF